MKGKRILPWIENPFRLWSLKDMLKVSAGLYILLGEINAKIKRLFETGETTPELLRTNLLVLKNNCDEVGLEYSSNLLVKAIADLPQTAREYDIYADAVLYEIDTHLFFHVPAHRAKYYNQYAIWLEDKLQWLAAFPEATLELHRAGNCYAFGEYTACVFHSMRAAEIGLRAFAIYPFLEVALDEPIGQMGWAKLIGKIEKAVESKVLTPKTPERDEQLRYCSEAAAQFRYFNLGWRVFSAHAKEIYDEDEAVKIMEAVTQFLQALAHKVSGVECGTFVKC